MRFKAPSGAGAGAAARRGDRAAAAGRAASAPPPRRRAGAPPTRPSSATSARAPHRTSARELGLLAGRPPARSTAATFSCTASAVDVLVEERRRAAVEAEPPQAVGVAPVGHRGRHLEQREVADDRAAQRRCRPNSDIRLTVASVTPGSVVEVGAVARVEARARPSRRRTAAAWMRSGRPLPYSSAWISTSAAFGAPLQPRQRPGVRVGLLELVGRAVDHELRTCSSVAVALEVARQRRRRRRPRRSRAARGRSPRVGGGRGRADRVEQRGLEARLERRARSASSDGSHSQSSATPGRPR